MSCIFCGEPVVNLSIEHIVPESLGNIDYILEPGRICAECNNSFSDFEDKALSKTMLGFERSRLGVATKKGKAAQAQSHNIKFVGDKKFRKNVVTIYGLDETNIESVGKDGSLTIKIMDFDKSDMATSKLLLKIGLESLYQSQRAIFKANSFKDLKDYLIKINNNNWPILTIAKQPEGFRSVPRFNDKKRLKNIHCEILFKEVDSQTLLLNFRYGVLSYLVNLKSRAINWTQPYFKNDNLANLYPEYLKKKVMPGYLSDQHPNGTLSE